MATRRLSRALVLAGLAAASVMTCAGAATWREMFSMSGGEGARITPPVKVDAEQWRVSCWIQRKERAEWSFFRVIVKDRGTGRPVRVLVATDADVPERGGGALTAEQAWKAALIRRAQVIGRGSFVCEVFATGVQWRLRMDAPGGPLVDEPELLRAEEDMRASSLEASWFVLNVVTADLLPQERGLSVEQNDWRVRYCVQPKRGEQAPSFVLWVRDLRTGDEKVVAAVPPSRLLAMAEGERQVVGATYLHESGTFEWKVQAVNVNWAAMVEMPAQGSGAAGHAAGRSAPTAPGDWPLEDRSTEEKPADRKGWDDWHSIEEGLKGFERD